MPQWDSKKFEEKAAEIAHAFLAERGDLHRLTVKAAKDKGLNEEQVHRLSRAVNVKAFEQKFASLKGKSDRIVEFDPVDSEAVIGDLFNKAPIAQKTAAAAYPDLNDQLGEFRGWAPTQVKTASVDVRAEVLNSVPKDPPIESQINHWRKVAEELRVKRAGAEMRWDSAMAELESQSKRLYWDRDEFEKDALALHGSDVLFEINALRQTAKMAALDIPANVAQKLAARLFGEESDATKLIKQAAEARALYAKTETGLSAAEAKVAELVARVLG